jgi:MFS family permease
VSYDDAEARHLLAGEYLGEGGWKVEKHSYAANIGINYLYTFFSNLNLTHGLWMIYLASQGFSLAQLGILEGVFHITSFLMEVPTGAVADLWGRKASRIAGRLVACVSLLVMLMAQSFIWQLFGFIITALGYNLESGAGDALVYDSLIMEHREHQYMKVAGRQELVYQSAAILAFLIGGYLAVRSYQAVFLISMGLALCSMVTALFFTEPRIAHEGKTPRTGSLVRHILDSMHSQTVESVKVIQAHPRIAFLILFEELLFTFITCLFFYLQNYWKDEGRTEWYIGIVFAAGSVAAGLTALWATAIEKRLGERGVLLYMPLMLLVCLWGVALSPWPAVFYLLTGCVEGILIAAVSAYLNKLIPSQNRATILSFQSMTFSMFMIIVFPLAGWLGQQTSLPVAFLGMAALGTLLYVPYVVLGRGKKSAFE